MLLSEALSTVEVPRAILKIFMLLLTSVHFFLSGEVSFQDFCYVCNNTMAQFIINQNIVMLFPRCQSGVFFFFLFLFCFKHICVE